MNSSRGKEIPNLKTKLINLKNIIKNYHNSVHIGYASNIKIKIS